MLLSKNSNRQLIIYLLYTLSKTKPITSFLLTPSNSIHSFLAVVPTRNQRQTCSSIHYYYSSTTNNSNTYTISNRYTQLIHRRYFHNHCYRPCQRQYHSRYFQSRLFSSHFGDTNSSISTSSNSSVDTLNNNNSLVPSYDIEYVQASIGLDRKLAAIPFTWEELQSIVQSNQLDKHARSMDTQAIYLSHVRFVKRYWNSVNDFILVDKFSFPRSVIPLSSCYHDDFDKNDENYKKKKEQEDALWNIQLPTLNIDESEYPPLGYKFISNPKFQDYISSYKTISNHKDLDTATNSDKHENQHDNNTNTHEKYGMRLVLKPNEFPYYVESNVQHWCLWKLGGYVTQDEIIHAINVELPNNIMYHSSKGNIQNKKNQEERNLKVKDTLYWVNPPHLKSVPDIDHAHILCLVEEI